MVGVVLRQTHARGGQRIDVRRAHLFVALHAQVAIAHVVGDQKHDIGLAPGRGPTAGRGCGLAVKRTAQAKKH